MQEINCCFIVLHYKAIEATEKCIESILNQKSKNNIRILVVDNLSNDNTGYLLRDKYSGNELVEVLILEHSTGFSNGNNQGYLYAKKHFPSKFYIFTNNDIIFDDIEFVQKMNSLYGQFKFDVAGPDIINTKDSSHASPLRTCRLSLSEAKKRKIRATCFYRFTFISLAISKLLSMINHRNKNSMQIKFDVTQQNVVLCGACLIFTASFLDKKGLPFFPETGFYYEEDILKYYIEKSSASIFYFPDIYVQHNHGVSTSKAYTNKIERQKFRSNEDIKSLSIYIKLIEDNMPIN